ncbi:MAG TPA: M28 family peptidase [Bryobacteraceae bacterium]|nr:M28 family peptidase [Bryobacteraceae bacterium]
MQKPLRLAVIATVLCVSTTLTNADEKALNPQVTAMLNDVSEARIKAILEKLVSFGTRNTMSNPDDPAHGVGAAREWILKEMQSYSPRLQVRFDKYRVKKQGQRVFKDVDLYNVIAVLPGEKTPETQVWISGHYDTLNLGTRPGGAAAGPGTDAPAPAVGERAPQAPLSLEQQEKNAELPAPGACDDGSGTAAVMELARVASKYHFDKTLVFAAFAGEEQGLIGSSLQASKAHKENVAIEAVLNNDIIGTDTAGNGRMSNTVVSVFSDETMDSPSQQLSRYVREVTERYMPSMTVETVFMGDRLGRGGDHTPFQWEGYAAVRLSTPNEIYANQHHATDLLENMSVPYTTKVAKVNLAVAASLALAPKAPLVTRAPGARGGFRGGAPEGATAQTTAQANGQGNVQANANGNAPGADGGRGGARGGAGTGAGAAGGRRPTPMIARGSGYDAVLTWRAAGSDEGIKGYTVLVRATTAPYWEKEIYVGKVTTFTMKDVSIDDAKFGVKAIGTDGSESLVTAYVYPPRVKTEVETVQ